MIASAARSPGCPVAVAFVPALKCVVCSTVVPVLVEFDAVALILSASVVEMFLLLVLLSALSDLVELPRRLEALFQVEVRATDMLVVVAPVILVVNLIDKECVSFVVFDEGSK